MRRWDLVGCDGESVTCRAKLVRSDDGEWCDFCDAERLERERDEAKAEVKKLEADLEAIVAPAEAGGGIVAYLRAELASLRSDLFANGVLLEALRTKRAQDKAEIARLTTDCRRLEMAAADANALVMSHEAKIEGLTAENNLLRPLCDGMAEQIRELVAMLDKNNDAQREAAVADHDKEREIKNLSAEVDRLTLQLAGTRVDESCRTITTTGSIPDDAAQDDFSGFLRDITEANARILKAQAEAKGES